jgi:hypothetical protein
VTQGLTDLDSSHDGAMGARPLEACLVRPP